MSGELPGLLIRRRDPDDRRLVRLYPTDQAREVYEEQRHLRGTLHKIIAELSGATTPAATRKP